ncbi:NACHT domain-containing protein [Bradyrhizobium sp. 27S5]|uniref:NACHT domain-containing protein n=1 Tax=Bradyrhizobium sp. 27S5 TaxID=3139728 RepID=UPI0030CC0447
MADITAAILAGISQATAAICKEIVMSTVGLAKAQAEKLTVELEIGFKKLTQRNLERCAKVKTLLHRYEPIDIERAYVHPLIGFARTEADQATFLRLFQEHCRIVVTGMAGSGKSMFMKYLYVTLCREPIGRIPIFIEMRHLNNTNANLLTYILNQISSIIKGFSQTQLEYCLAHGKFVLMLDGLDEVEHTLRDQISDQILELTFKYARTLALISSRPLDRFSSWTEFHVGEILPLDKEQVNELINKIDYDEASKKKFLNEVNSSIFETHEEFLSNPLLCTMMLMTFEEFAEIPSKMHVFYEQAFNVLYSKHDATKASFKRKFYTTLSVDDFKRVLTTYCLFSYVDRQISFNEEAARQYTRKAALYETVTVNDQMFVNDLQEPICLLLKDGDSLAFLHRSFQEYFTALFLAQRDVPQIGKIIELLVESAREDNVISMLIDMNRPAFEAKFYEDRIRKLSAALHKIDIDNHPIKVFRMLFSAIHYDGEDDHLDNKVTVVVSNSKGWFSTYALLRQFYSIDGYPWFDEETVLRRAREIDGDTHSARNNLEISLSDIDDQLLIEVGFVEFALKLREHAASTLRTIEGQAKQRNNIVAEMLAR